MNRQFSRTWKRIGALALILCASCASTDVREELSGAGFRTPEQTFNTYRAAFLADLVELEYRCFSAGFRRANGMTILNYGEAREILLDEQSFLRFGISKAQIENVERLSNNRARLKLRSESLFHEVQFTCELVREDFYEIWADGERLQDDHLDRFSDAFRITADQAGRPTAQAWIALENPEFESRITEFRVGREWKIDFINLLADKTNPHGLESREEGHAP